MHDRWQPPSTSSRCFCAENRHSPWSNDRQKVFSIRPFSSFTCLLDTGLPPPFQQTPPFSLFRSGKTSMSGHHAIPLSPPYLNGNLMDILGIFRAVMSSFPSSHQRLIHQQRRRSLMPCCCLRMSLVTSPLESQRYPKSLPTLALKTLLTGNRGCYSSSLTFNPLSWRWRSKSGSRTPLISRQNQLSLLSVWLMTPPSVRLNLADFTGVLTKSKETRQDILQTVELARRAFPRATRKCFLGEVSAASSVEELMGAAQYDARDK